MIFLMSLIAASLVLIGAMLAAFGDYQEAGVALLMALNLNVVANRQEPPADD